MPSLFTAASAVLLAAVAGAADPGRYQPPAGAPYQAEEVRIHPDGPYSLGGTLTVPHDRRKRHPVLLVIPGAGPEDRDHAHQGSPYRPFYDLADTLSQRGIAVLRLDPRGVGASTGRPGSATLLGRIEDTRAALRFLRARRDIDDRRIGLLGFAEGGFVAPMIAAEDSTLAGVVLMAPQLPLGVSPIRDSLFARRGIRVPVLILRGTRDEVASLHCDDSLATLCRGEGNHDVTIELLDGLTHDFLPADSTARVAAALRLPSLAQGAITDWLMARIDPGFEVAKTERRSPPPSVHVKR